MSQANQIDQQADVSVNAEEGEYEHGHMLGGRYQVIGCLGRGGMGTVYRVNQIFLGKQMALKTINKSYISETAIRRFQQEAQTSLAIDHPNIIEVTDFGLLDDDTPFLVMEILQGETLGDRLKRTGPLTVSEAIDIFIQVSFGIAHAHELGIVHRDIKPNNIMLLNNRKFGTEGSVKIVDFGIAKYSAREGGEVQALTKTGEIFGSPLYMSPEQCTGESVDQRSDIYSLGCVMFEALTGRPPIIGETAMTTMMKHLSEPAPSLSQTADNRSFSSGLEKIVAKMLCKDKNQRYSNLSVVAYDLASLKTGDGGKVANAKHAQKRASKDVDKTPGIQISKLAFISMLIGLGLFTSAITFGAICFSDSLEQTNAEKLAIKHAMEVDDEVKGSGPIPKKFNDLDAATRDVADVKRMLKSDATQAKLRSCAITAEGIDQISKSKNVTVVDFRDGQVPNDHMYPLHNLHLTNFEASGTNLDDVGFEQMLPQNNLRYLHAAKTALTDQSVPHIAKIHAMDNLDLSSTEVSDEAIAQLAAGKNIRWLALNHCRRISDEGIRSLEDSGIVNLELSDVELTVKALNYLAKCKQLRALDIGTNRFMVEDIEEFCKHSKITSLFLKHCAFIGDGEIGKLQEEFPRIKFSNNHQIKNLILDPR